jgi:glutamyl-Q tRNA(Asp) synthetase
VDTPRCSPDADFTILKQLAACGLHSDLPPVWQSQRGRLYKQALDQLKAAQLAYPCACSRKDIETALARSGLEKPRNTELIYPETCRSGLQGKPGRAWRMRTDDFVQTWPLALVECAQQATEFIAVSPSLIVWSDRLLGRQQQNVAKEVGDFVLQRADGLWAYQLAVVVDDADQGVTHVVRGQDLCDNTARQILLQRALSLQTPQYLHTPLVLSGNGEKLSKQNGAQALDTSSAASAFQALTLAASALDLAPPTRRDNTGDALAAWIAQWATRPECKSPPKDTP